VQVASSDSKSKWERDDSSEDDLTEEAKQHKQEFTEWRKKHYNEYFAVKRAKELMRMVS